MGTHVRVGMCDTGRTESCRDKAKSWSETLKRLLPHGWDGIGRNRTSRRHNRKLNAHVTTRPQAGALASVLKVVKVWNPM